MKIKIVLFAFLFSFMGCAKQKVKPADVEINYASRLETLGQKNKYQKKIIQDLKDQNSVMRKLLSDKGHDFDRGGSVRSRSYGKKNNSGGERKLYRKVQLAFQSKNLLELKKWKKIFLDRFPISIFSDNVIYLKGQLELALNTPKESLKSFDELLKSYPLGNKVGSAMLGKAMALRMIKNVKQANDLLEKVIKTYPGSPESLTAKKIMASAKGH